MDESIERFRSLVAPWVSAYGFIAASAMGVFVEKDRKVLSARLILAPNLEATFQRRPLDGPLFWARTAILPFSEMFFQELLRSLSAGVIRFDGIEASLPLDAGNQQISASVFENHPDTAGLHSIPRLPTLVVAGADALAIVYKFLHSAEVGWHLRSMDPPFADLSDLCGYYMLPQIFHGRSAVLEVVARPPVEFNPTSLIDARSARIRLVATKGADPAQVAVGFSTLDGLQREHVAPDRFVWTTAEGRMEGEATVEIKDAQSIHCFLAYAPTFRMSRRPFSPISPADILLRGNELPHS